jgi:dTDP-glucose pyrophosphorylase
MYLPIVFLAAGKGTRFSENPEPKILVPVGGAPMAVTSIRNLLQDCMKPNMGPEDIFGPIVIITEEINKEYPELKTSIEGIDPNVNFNFMLQSGYLNGPAESASVLTTVVSPDSALFMSNVDQLVQGDIIGEITASVDEGFDGAIFCFESNEDRYSYVKTDEYPLDKEALEMVEKEVISNKASSGHIFFKEASTFFDNLEPARLTVREGSEVYISTVCNEAIKSGKKFKVVMLDSFKDLGTPEDLASAEEDGKL